MSSAPERADVGGDWGGLDGKVSSSLHWLLRLELEILLFSRHRSNSQSPLLPNQGCYRGGLNTFGTKAGHIKDLSIFPRNAPPPHFEF